MTLPSSGALSFSDLQTEFGGSNPISMSEYYAGGGRVPASTGSVPSSGAITVGVFHGTTAYQNLALSGSSSASNECHVGLAPGNCTASASVTLTLTGGNGSPTLTWARQSGATGLTETGQGTLTFGVSKSLAVGSAGPGASASAVYRCTAHDGVGPDATFDVTFDLTSFGDND